MKLVFVFIGLLGLVLLVVGVVLLALVASKELDGDRLLKDGTKKYGYELLVGRIDCACWEIVCHPLCFVSSYLLCR